jgi:DNA-binding transcriptional LysR family regulator
VGFVADYVARQDAQVQRVLPELPIDPLNIWLVVHREIRHSKRIRAVYDFLAQALPAALR